ncbi:hypothetical protein [Legionella londiniensis]|uniref:Competence protein A n=1 Tax=Legionella londiniensis TaxID=45068 RepID=A0A0W0VID2_9GAMM|nr:hypothetical protein [Legionella londiniensis]KTD19880.1 Competence protein A [Legionella londiniensis]STX94248.1 type IV pilus assembly protein PilM [Legionella londiniensis]
MFGFNFNRGKRSIACCLGEKQFAISAIENNQKLLFSKHCEFAEKIPQLIAQGLAREVESLHLIGASCEMILWPRQYQLLLMDALEVPEEEMAKAFRWRLKGLVEYPLNDLAIDVFSIPSHGVAGRRKKVFVAVTSMSSLKAKIEILEKAFLEVQGVGIAELALRNLVSLALNNEMASAMVISLEDKLCQLQVIYQNKLYLVRELPMGRHLKEDPKGAESMLLEIQRSIDYCLSELKLPEPQEIFFTPMFYKAKSFLQYLERELHKEIKLLDINEYLQVETPIGLKAQQDRIYSIGGALAFNFNNDKGQNPT